MPNTPLGSRTLSDIPATHLADHNALHTFYNQAGGAPLISSVGAGLPTFTGRKQGDLHFDSTAHKEYVLSGTVGAQFSDTFTRSDRDMVTGELAETGQAYTRSSAGGGAAEIRIVSGRLVSSPDAAANGRGLSFPGSTGDRTIAVDYYPYTGSGGGQVLGLGFAGNLTLAISYGYDWSCLVSAASGAVLNLNLNAAGYSNEPVTVSMDLVGQVLTAKLVRIADNVVVATGSATLSNADFAAIGTTCLIRLGAYDQADNLSSYAYGSLVWNPTTPAPTNIETVNTVATASTAQTLPDVSVATLHRLTFSAASCAITLPTPVAGKSISVVLVQDATGGRAATWVTPTGIIKWAGGGTPPTLTAGAGKEDVVSFLCADGANWIGLVAGTNV